MRYYLAQRVLTNSPVIGFMANPLEADACPELEEHIENWNDTNLLFRDQVNYCLGRLVERQDILDTETMLKRFEVSVYPHLSDQLDRLEAALLGTYSDPQLPITISYD